VNVTRSTRRRNISSVCLCHHDDVYCTSRSRTSTVIIVAMVYYIHATVVVVWDAPENRE
jgi:hypothetical protein